MKWVHRSSHLPLVGLLTLATLAILGMGDSVHAQGDFDHPPEKGGLTYSLGMPPVYKGFSGFEMQSFRTSNDFTQLAAFLNWFAAW